MGRSASAWCQNGAKSTKSSHAIRRSKRRNRIKQQFGKIPDKLINERGTGRPTVIKPVGNPSGFGVGNKQRISKKALRKMRIKINHKGIDEVEAKKATLESIEAEKAALLASGLITEADVKAAEDEEMAEGN